MRRREPFLSGSVLLHCIDYPFGGNTSPPHVPLQSSSTITVRWKDFLQGVPGRALLSQPGADETCLPGPSMGRLRGPQLRSQRINTLLFSSGPGRLHVLGRNSQWLLLRTWVFLFCCCCGNRNKASSYQLCKARFNPVAAKSFVMALPSVLDMDGASRPRVSPQTKAVLGQETSEAET